ncbi:hypothetical protein Ccur_11460 [Cryptobacterium curtum DSM 15641]|uniref:Uncharacterized protein n=1 Tax=Cryptobacterium curtum (strain ATCC 700683 / DSM 15641 / CCUG 43107 / 12-3) TaxID=469378 RepID=C7MPJ5_CRYCD|nr:hypothetical protein Ccur_11460 [Cryptobacterium curtum DSM 15641]
MACSTRDSGSIHFAVVNIELPAGIMKQKQKRGSKASKNKNKPSDLDTNTELLHE